MVHRVVDGLLPCRSGYAEWFESIFEFPVFAFVGNYGHLRTPFDSLKYESVNFASGYQKRGAKAVGIFLYYL